MPGLIIDKSLRVVLLVDALLIGGAETFVLRLAKALQLRGFNVHLCILRGELVNWELVRRLTGDISVTTFRISGLRGLLRLDGLLFRIGSKFSFVRWIQVSKLQRYLFSIRPHVLHSNLITSDLVASRACASRGIPWVSTMHGDYLAFEAKGGRNRAARIQDFAAAMCEVESSVGHLVCITDQQTAQLRRLLPRADSEGRISKIYNGYAATPGNVGGVIEPPAALNRIPGGAFVIGMVARGIRDKGWEVMVSAFQQLDLSDTWLVLVGDGDYLQTLRTQVRHPRVIFTGDVVDPLSYIARFDVGCLPSRIPTESLPTVIIEYLLLGKPVIATDVGEVSRMIDAGTDGAAGMLIALDSVEAMAGQMKQALERLYRDPAERSRLQACACVAAGKFDMDRCVDQYLAVYEAAQ